MPIISGDGGGGGLPSWIQSGAASPIGAVVPTQTGALYEDLTNGALYAATGATNTSWVLVGGKGDTAATGVFSLASGQLLLLGGASKRAILTDVDAAANSGNGLYWNFNQAADGTQRLVAFTGAGGSFEGILQDENGNTQLPGIVTELGVKTTAITSGALPTTTFVSGTGKQILTARDVVLVVPCTLNPTAGAAGTVAVALSPDNVTYSALVTITEPAGIALDGTIIPASLQVPAAWYVKLTATNAAIGTGTYY